jgi:hypothetical protein
MTGKAFRNIMIVSRLLEAYWDLHGVLCGEEITDEQYGNR